MADQASSWEAAASLQHSPCRSPALLTGLLFPAMPFCADGACVPASAGCAARVSNMQRAARGLGRRVDSSGHLAESVGAVQAPGGRRPRRGMRAPGCSFPAPWAPWEGWEGQLSVDGAALLSPVAPAATTRPSRRLSARAASGGTRMLAWASALPRRPSRVRRVGWVQHGPGKVMHRMGRQQAACAFAVCVAVRRRGGGGGRRCAALQGGVWIVQRNWAWPFMARRGTARSSRHGASAGDFGCSSGLPAGGTQCDSVQGRRRGRRRGSQEQGESGDSS